MMSVSQISTTVMKMLYASILLEVTTVFASQAIPGTEPRAKVKGLNASPSHIRDNAVHLHLPPLLLIAVISLLGTSHSRWELCSMAHTLHPGIGQRLRSPPSANVFFHQTNCSNSVDFMFLDLHFSGFHLCSCLAEHTYNHTWALLDRTVPPLFHLLRLQLFIVLPQVLLLPVVPLCTFHDL